MVSKEKINEFISDSHGIACSHGFHDVVRNDEHYMMLVLSEIGEMVEADRKNRRADVDTFKELEKIRIGSDAEYASYINKCFAEHIKDTVEDELADVCIRLFDYCGLRHLTPLMLDDGVVEMKDDFERIYGAMSICEQCFYLSCLVTDVLRCCSGKSDKEEYLGMILSFCFEFARHHGIDLVWHIEQKMRYNSGRSKRHGKEY